jgi:hypothetical protein
VVLQAELALEGVEHRLDPLSDAAETAMPARFVAAVRAQQPHAEPGYLLFDVAPCQALVGQHRGAGDNQPGLDGDGQQVQADLPLAPSGSTTPSWPRSSWGPGGLG